MWNAWRGASPGRPGQGPGTRCPSPRFHEKSGPRLPRDRAPPPRRAVSEPRHPWSTDRHLDLPLAREVLALAFPEVDLDGLAWVGRGWDYDVYRAGPWAFRFPRRAAYAANASWEPRLLRLVRPVLEPFEVAVPVPELRTSAGPLFPYPVTGHRWIPGVDASTLPARVAREELPLLGRCLRAIHALDPRAVRAAGVPPSDWPMAARLRETLADLPGLEERVAPGDGEVRRAMAWAAALGEADIPPEPSTPPRPIHGDLGAEHILMDPGTGTLTGLIDWSDAVVGDPANDFVGVAATWGRAGLDRALEAYGPTDPGLRARAVFMARVSSLHWLHDALLQGGDGARHRRWIRNASELGEG